MSDGFTFFLELDKQVHGYIMIHLFVHISLIYRYCPSRMYASKYPLFIHDVTETAT